MLSFALTCQVAFGQLPESVELRTSNVTVVLRNLRWMTTQKVQRVEGEFGKPVDPKPLDAAKLYHPDTVAYLYFDYERQIEPSDKPDGFTDLWVSIIGPQMPHTPFALKEAKGVGYAGLAFCGSDGQKPHTRVDGPLDLKVIFYGKTNGGQTNQFVMRDLKLNIAVDGVATITTTQFEALKSLYGRVKDLEKRVIELEKQKEARTNK